jgi:hypothetical protein
MFTFLKHDTSHISLKAKCRGLQRDVVYLGGPIAPSYMSANAGGGRELRGLTANEYMQLYTGAQINFGDLTPYLTYGQMIKAFLKISGFCVLKGKFF